MQRHLKNGDNKAESGPKCMTGIINDDEEKQTI